MNRLCFAAAALFAVAAPRPALAQTALFRQRAEVDLSVDEGLVRIELPAEIVAACGPSLGDLRVIDNGGSNRPYVVDGAPPAGEQVTSIAITPAEARQLVETPAGATPRHREEYDLDLPEVAPPGGTWSIVLETDNPHFTDEARVERFGPDGSVELLTARTVFRLPSGPARLEIPLPRGASGRLRLRFSGEQGFLSPRFEARSVVPPAEPTFLSVELPVESTEHVDGKTILVVRRPLALVPSSISLSTPEPTVQRYVRVVDAGADGTQAIVGEALVSRVAGAGAGATLEIPLDGARGDRLRIEITDADSGPLRDLRIDARIHQPSLIFDASSTYRPLWLYFGGARALHPSFPEGSALLRASREGPPPAVARIRSVEENPVYSDEPALAFASRPGPAVEIEAYAHEASVTIPESPEGLVRIVVPAAIEARVDPARRDLRLVDEGNRQRPYIAGFEPHTEEAALRVERTSPRARTSRYSLSFAEGPLEVHELALRVAAEYVDRPYRLFAPGAAEGAAELLLAFGRLRRRPGDPAILRIPVNARVARLFLEVDDGDDGPLALRPSATIGLPVLYVAAPRGEYRFVFGIPATALDVTPPSYELEAERDLVLAVPAVDARVGSVRDNPRFAPPSPYSASRMRDVALWAVLGLAVLVLGALTFRLAKLAPAPIGTAAVDEPPPPRPLDHPAPPAEGEDDPEPPAGGPA